MEYSGEEGEEDERGEWTWRGRETDGEISRRARESWGLIKGRAKAAGIGLKFRWRWTEVESCPWFPWERSFSQCWISGLSWAEPFWAPFQINPQENRAFLQCGNRSFQLLLWVDYSPSATPSSLTHCMALIDTKNISAGGGFLENSAASEPFSYRILFLYLLVCCFKAQPLSGQGCDICGTPKMDSGQTFQHPVQSSPAWPTTAKRWGVVIAAVQVGKWDGEREQLQVTWRVGGRAGSRAQALCSNQYINNNTNVIIDDTTSPPCSITLVRISC